VRSGDDRQVCHRLLQRLAFSETRHNRDVFPANIMAYDSGTYLGGGAAPLSPSPPPLTATMFPKRRATHLGVHI
jgi:hypothetical protein